MNSTSVELSTEQYRILALAVAAQCATLVHELASRGQTDQAAVQACLHPLFVFDADSTADIYPDPAAFSKGLEALQQMYSQRGPAEYGHIIRYLSGLLMLQKALSDNRKMQNDIRQGLMRFEQKKLVADPGNTAEMTFSSTDMADLSALYQGTVSTLNYRVHVSGNAEYLQSPVVADSIRSLLFAGIRSAMLWQQLGGRRWHLLFYRKRIRQIISTIRRTLITLH